MGNEAFQEIEIGAEADEAALLLATREAMRRDNGVLCFRCADDNAPADEAAYVAWLSLLADGRPFLCMSGKGRMGPHGLALMLACDMAVLSPDATCGTQPAAAPGLVALARRRLGAAAMRRLLLHRRDPVHCLSELGQITFDADPDAAVKDSISRLGGPVAAAALRSAMRAAEELSFAEACDFEIWSRTLQKEGLS